VGSGFGHRDPWHGKRQAWIQCIDATLSGDITGKGLRWSHPIPPHSTSTPAIQEGRVYITDFSGTIHCLDAATGNLHWAHQVPGEIWGSPLLAEGKLYVATRRGDLWVLSASSALQVIQRVEFSEPLSTSPVAANGTLYVATPRRLYALAAP
jgi:outer membrane protein assembly factor BamB